MSDEVIKATARRIGEIVAAENGVSGACDAIESAFATYQARRQQ
jgi:hypothetical protein